MLNGNGLYFNERNRHFIKAYFRGELQIVFEGINHKECLQYCHKNGLHLLPYDKWFTVENAWFRKKNAKHKYNPEEWKIGTVY